MRHGTWLGVPWRALPVTEPGCSRVALAGESSSCSLKVTTRGDEWWDWLEGSFRGSVKSSHGRVHTRSMQRPVSLQMEWNER